MIEMMELSVQVPPGIGEDVMTGDAVTKKKRRMMVPLARNCCLRHICKCV